MKKLYLGLFLVFLSGCFNLKTPLPSITFYDLDFEAQAQQQCSKSPYVAFSEIQASPVYDTREIIFKQNDNQISSIKQMQWIDLPKKMLKRFLIKQFATSCVKLSLPPLGAIKNDFLLKVELLNFEILQDSQNKEWVHIALFYELLDFKDPKVIKSGMIERQDEVKKGYVDSFRNTMEKVGNALIAEVKQKVGK